MQASVVVSSPNYALQANEHQVENTATRREQLFRELYDRYWKDVRNYVVWFVEGKGDVEDILQEVFLRVHERLDDYDPARPARPWLFRVSSNVALNLAESQGAQKRNIEDGQTVSLSCTTSEDDYAIDMPDHRETLPEEDAVQQETVARLRGLLADLPDEDRQMVEALYFTGLSQREAAETLQIPRRTIGDRHRRLLEMLRTQLEPESDSAA